MSVMGSGRTSVPWTDRWLQCCQPSMGTNIVICSRMLQDEGPFHKPVPVPARESFIWDYGYDYLRTLLFVIFINFSCHVVWFCSSYSDFSQAMVYLRACSFVCSPNSRWKGQEAVQRNHTIASSTLDWVQKHHSLRRSRKRSQQEPNQLRSDLVLTMSRWKLTSFPCQKHFISLGKA